MNEGGATLLTATFAKTGTAVGNPTFKALVPRMKSDGSAPGVEKLEIQGLNSDGTTDWGFNYAWDGAKWVDYNTYDDASDVEFTQGQGLWIYNNTGAAVVMQGVGQVSEFDAAYLMNAGGATPVGNCYPVGTTWGQVVPVAPAGVKLAGNLEVQGLNSDGTTNWDYNYYWDGTKWLDYNTEEDATNLEIPVGKGLWIYNNSGSDQVVLQIAAPEL